MKVGSQVRFSFSTPIRYPKGLWLGTSPFPTNDFPPPRVSPVDSQTTLNLDGEFSLGVSTSLDNLPKEEVDPNDLGRTDGGLHELSAST